MNIPAIRRYFPFLINLFPVFSFIRQFWQFYSSFVKNIFEPSHTLQDAVKICMEIKHTFVPVGEKLELLVKHFWNINQASYIHNMQSSMTQRCGHANTISLETSIFSFALCTHKQHLKWILLIFQQMPWG